MTGFGGPEVLHVDEVRRPQPGRGEVLIYVEAAGVAYGDIMKRQGAFGTVMPLPSGLGQEVAGTVAAVGPDVDSPQIGSKVAAFVEHGYADYAVASVATTVTVPDGVDARSAAALWIQGVTAYQTLVEAGALQRGDTVLVHAAAGGVGTLATQLAKVLGARLVVGAVGRPDKFAHVRRHGGDAVVDYSQSNWPQEVLDATAGRGADLVLDSVGGDVARQTLMCMAPFGRIVAFGAAGGDPASYPSMSLMNNNGTVSGYSLTAWLEHRPHRSAQALQELLGLVARKQVHVAIGNSYPLERVADAHRAISERRTIGKTVLMPHGVDGSAAV